MNEDHWQGKVAVITGAASGIGAGLARHAAKVGMVVIAADVDEKGLGELQDTAAAQDHSIHIVTTDVADAEAVEQLATTAFDRHGKVNLFFNNAGVLVDGKSWERSTRDWRWIVDVNIMGVVHGIRSFVPRMLHQGEEGRVINTSSIGGLLGGGAYMAPYQGTKHCVTAISESLYRELELESAPVSASVLCPAEVVTGIWHSDRLRAAHEHNQLSSDAEQQFHDMVAEGVAQGLTPDEFATRVFAGIEEGKFWLLPQPEFKPMFGLRTDSIHEESNPLSMEDMMRMIDTD